MEENINFSSHPNHKIPANADKISVNHIPGINRVVKLDIVIEGKSVRHFKHFRLLQSARRHHHFELILAHDSLESAQNHNLEEARQFLGKRITVVFKYKDYENESPERTFVGVITKAAFSQEKMSLGNIVLKGESPTILMDSAPHTQSFGGTQSVNTGIIADKIIKDALGSSKFDFRIDPQNKSYINYTSQYNETHYNFLARTAEAYGEQFYYDGEILHFGKLPPSEKPVRLIYGSNVSDVQVELKAVHTKPEYFGYNSSSHTKMEGSENNIRHLGEIPSKAYELNNSIFKTRSLSPAPVNPNMFMDVDDSQKSAAGSAAVEVFTVSGNTTVPFLYPGCCADIEMRKPDTSETSYFTKIAVTEVVHEVNARGYYTGSFEAVAEGTGFMPKPDFMIPSAQPQVATVISNTDPMNQGRIQVQFDWQRNPDTTHFIRMMSPDAGGTDVVTQNRGYVAIPEVGDQVMVGFEYHHPDFPFAMGGMFHGQVALGGNVDNRVKSIQTRSGHRVIFTEDESIVITDKSGNEIHLDTTGSNINITAPETMTLNCKNMNINVGENMNTIVGQNQSNSVGMNISETAGMNKTTNIGMLNMLSVGTDFITNVVGKMTEFIQGNKESHTEKDRVRVANGKITTQSQGTFEQHAKKEVQNNSGQKSKNH